MKRQRKVSDEESFKKQKLEEDNDAEKDELRAILDVVSRDDIAINVESLATNHPIVDWKTYIRTENMMDQGLAQSDAELAQRLYEEEFVEVDKAQKERQKLTHEEQEQFTIKEMEKLLVEFFERRKKQLAAERSGAIRNKPTTRTQVKNRMITYLKHMGKYTHQQLKHKSLEELQKLYQKE
nr:hypothetical protein [Tanacetum cinerariifolium]